MSHDLFFVFLRCAEEGLVIIISSVRGKHTFPRSHSCRMCCSAGQSKFELMRPPSAYSIFLRCHRNMTTQITSQGGYPLGSIAGQLKGNELVSLRVGPCSQRGSFCYAHTLHKRLAEKSQRNRCRSLVLSFPSSIPSPSDFSVCRM